LLTDHARFFENVGSCHWTTIAYSERNVVRSLTSRPTHFTSHKGKPRFFYETFNLGGSCTTTFSDHRHRFIASAFRSKPPNLAVLSTFYWGVIAAQIQSWTPAHKYATDLPLSNVVNFLFKRLNGEVVSTNHTVRKHSFLAKLYRPKSLPCWRPTLALDYVYCRIPCQISPWSVGLYTVALAGEKTPENRAFDRIFKFGGFYAHIFVIRVWCSTRE